MRILNCILCASAVAVAACASGSGSNSPATVASPTTETVRVMGSGQTGGAISLGMVATPTGAYEAQVQASADAVWRALPAAFDSLGIPLTVQDAASKTIGNAGLKARRRVGKTAAIRFFDCGSTQGAPSAETYDLIVSVMTQVLPGEDGNTKLSTRAEAQGRPVAFSGEYVRCSSSGAMEKRIVDVVRMQVAR